MGTADRLTVIATGAAIVMAVVGGSCSTNARIGDLHARIDEVRSDLGARIDEVRSDLGARIDEVRSDLGARIDATNARIDDLRSDLGARIDETNVRIDRLETRLDGVDGRLRNVEFAFGKVDQRLLTLERVLLPAPAD